MDIKQNIMREQYRSRVSQCIKFLTRALDKNNFENYNDKFRSDFDGLSSILMQLTMYLHEFNFYPSDIPGGHCCEVAFFTSLTGGRWNLEKKEKISFEQMYKYLINHCQGKCSNTTKYAIIIADNWDDDIASFWQPNIEKLKAVGIIVEVHMIIGKNDNTYEL
jgi:hypothetical protein